MEYKLATNDNEVLTKVAKLHIDALSYRSFITLFGVEFLAKLYRAVIKSANGFVYVAVEDNILNGFVFGSYNSTEMFRVINKNIWQFIPHILVNILKNPSLLLKLFQTITYKDKVKIGVNAELVVIAVDKNCRSVGIGANLVKLLEHDFVERQINAYKVTVHSQMVRANNFYRRNGFYLAHTFDMYGTEWNLYVKQIHLA